METLSGILGDEVLTVRQVAERLGVSVAKVHRLIDRKRLAPDVKEDGKTGRYYFKASTIDAYEQAVAS